MRFIKYSYIAISILSSFVSNASYAINIFGSDQRQVYTPKAGHPLTPVVRVVSRNTVEGIEHTGICTGALIANRYVLTAGHCVNANDPMTVYVGYKNGKFMDSSVVVRTITTQLEKNVKTRPNNFDWAILELEKPLGRKFGFFQISNLDLNKSVFSKSFSAEWLGRIFDIRYDNNVTLGGYSVDVEHTEVLSVNVNCHLYSSSSWFGFEMDKNILLHDCAMDHGSSGGPILIYNQAQSRYEIIAVNIAFRSLIGGHGESLKYKEFSPIVANVAVEVRNNELFQKLYSEIMLKK